MRSAPFAIATVKLWEVEQDIATESEESGSEAEEEEGFRDILKFLPSAPAWQQPIVAFFQQ